MSFANHSDVTKFKSASAKDRPAGANVPPGTAYPSGGFEIAVAPVAELNGE